MPQQCRSSTSTGAYRWQDTCHCALSHGCAHLRLLLCMGWGSGWVSRVARSRSLGEKGWQGRHGAWRVGWGMMCLEMQSHHTCSASKQRLNANPDPTCSGTSASSPRLRLAGWLPLAGTAGVPAAPAGTPRLLPDLTASIEAGHLCEHCMHSRGIRQHQAPGSGHQQACPSAALACARRRWRCLPSWRQGPPLPGPGRLAPPPLPG